MTKVNFNRKRPCYNKAMTIHYPKSHNATLFISLLIILLALGSALAVYRYQHRAHVPEGLTLQQAVNQRDDALKALQIHDAVNTTNENGYKATIANQTTANTKLANDRTVLCTQIKAAKLKQPLCQ